MKHFLIYANEYKDKNLVTANRIRDFLQLKGQRAAISVMGGGREAGREPGEGGTEDIPADADCMIVLGGDGTVLEAVRAAKGRQIPIIGVNLGTLGYMTEIEPSGLEEALERLIAGDYVQESRMMLNGRILLSDGRVKEGWALNDIVISRSGSLQIIRFGIYVNGQFLNQYHADGMIVTTPTGSTGYNLSAGGPLVEPGAELIMLTPICPHSLNQRSIILSSRDIVEIEIPECREGREQTVEVSFDGSHVTPLRTGDRIRIARSDKVTEFIRLNQVSFLEVLHRKMQG
ncbi:NAD(+)/NADH kinase [Acetatifactor muris]|jgi:NAD+ kinase|uniref:NAD kinase n=1 Tax=Acetatifactor muris TaxID=879566 RepID=A0A2K4ZEG7_9FIRM|nr:NAD(+)/NADH kinase [Acetatifactor muris]MCR2048460.1 NAD(+)/NADH kinase [Acetatifactor muris]SOY28846.1 putative inorganic polyphosphate/ATP-NAD kinase [Acetatifactor muris]